MCAGCYKLLLILQHVLVGEAGGAGRGEGGLVNLVGEFKSLCFFVYRNGLVFGCAVAYSICILIAHCSFFALALSGSWECERAKR